MVEWTKLMSQYKGFQDQLGETKTGPDNFIALVYQVQGTKAALRDSKFEH